MFAAFLELLEKNCVPASVDEDKLQQELCFWGMPSLEDLDLEDESCDTESDSPHKQVRPRESSVTSNASQVPSNVRAAVEVRTADSRLDMRYSMRGDEMFGRAIALVRQEDMVVRVSDIQHGLALLRELLSVEKNNVAYMYYMSYGEMRLGRAAESAYWSDKVLKIDPCNLAAASLKTLINDKRKQNSLTGVLVVGGALLGVAAAWYVFSKE